MTDLVQFLPWDSDFFGCRIGRVQGHLLDAEGAAEVAAVADAERLDCVYFLAEDDEVTVRTAEDHGFRLMDVRVEYALTVEGSTWQRPAGVREGIAADRIPLSDVAAQSYVQSRFFRDANFADARCEQLYRTWLERSFDDYADAVIVTEEADGPAGFVTCHIRTPGELGTIGLVGVHSRARGRGIGQKTVTGALAWFADNDVTRVEVVTQGRNVGAQRLYQNCGFRLIQTRLWYHRWFTS